MEGGREQHLCRGGGTGPVGVDVILEDGEEADGGPPTRSVSVQWGNGATAAAGAGRSQN